MILIAIQLSQLLAVEQAQQSLQFAAVVGGGVKLEGKSASIKSSSKCIQSSDASFFSSSFSRISLAGLRRQLSIRKNERKGESDEPDAPLLLDWELAVEEVDVVVGRKQSNQANDSANKGFQEGFAIEPQPPPGQHRIRIPKSSFHPKQPSRTRTTAIAIRPYSTTP